MNRVVLNPSSLSIDQLPGVIQRYRITFNQGCFRETASLFTPRGQLIPPFDPPVVGPAAIESYLQEEARGMEIEFHQLLAVPLAPEHSPCIKVGGKVKTSFFSVNAAWTFDRASVEAAQLSVVNVELIASWEELLSLRSS